MTSKEEEQRAAQAAAPKAKKSAKSFSERVAAEKRKRVDPAAMRRTGR